MKKISNIVLGITGSIAAYKSIELIKLLQDEGYNVDIALSKSAPEFVSITTLKSLFPGQVHLCSELLTENDEILHIFLAKKADLLLIAPCSANSLAKIAGGIADCLLSQIYLATLASVAIVPAMNKIMWDKSKHHAQNLAIKGVEIWGPATGLQACGDFGEGRMLEPPEIVEMIEMISLPKTLTGRKIVITAGPTYENIDPVRFITNRSSGKMGYALAKIARMMGAEVVLISGPVKLQPPQEGIEFVPVESAEQMLETAKKYLDTDVFIGAAAVADYRPVTCSLEKIKKNDSNMTIEFVRTIDIISMIKSLSNKMFVIGFAAETTDCLAYGQKKLLNKNLDMVVVNDVSAGKVFDQDENEVHILSKEGSIFCPRDSKKNIAIKILEVLARELLNK